MELRKAVALFLGEHKPTTVQAYYRPLELMRDFIGPAREVSGIRPEHLIEYVQMVLDQKGYAPATRQKHIKTLKTFWNWCVKLDLVEKSPARAVRGKKLPGAVDRSKAMTDAELAALLNVVREKPRDYALVLFLADTGCRRGGAVGLRLQDVDWDKLTAEVTEKGEKKRFVAFSEICAQALRRWLFYRSTRYAIKGVYLFSQDGQPMNTENISRIIRRACKLAGIRSLGAHSLRHRKGHQLADARIAPSIAASVLGHSDPMITVKYYFPAGWEDAEKAMRELMTNPDTLTGDPPNVLQFNG